MVGENTAKTGGFFLIEKMPDPSAIWTRGDDRHTEWGGSALTKEEMTPHYFNDFVLNRALEQASTNGWVVGTNPFEGGSDHVPFLRAGIPGLLLWHFTDRFYHTDGDRLEMVSADEMRNVGITALGAALTLASADGNAARRIVDEVRFAALARIEGEAELSRAEIEGGASVENERDILRTWAEWYDLALVSTSDIEIGGATPDTRASIEAARAEVAQKAATAISSIGR
jgi:hypothetical protein